MAKRSTKGTVGKGESLNIRISPKTKYGLEILARKQHRTLTSVVEWALDKALKDETEGLCEILTNMDDGFPDSEHPTYVRYLGEELWDPDEIQRFLKLAFKWKQLMTFEEESMWRFICDNSHYWAVTSFNNEESWNTVTESDLFIDRVADDWENLKLVAQGTLPPTSLTNWSPPERRTGTFRMRSGVTQDTSFPF